MFVAKDASEMRRMNAGSFRYIFKMKRLRKIVVQKLFCVFHPCRRIVVVSPVDARSFNHRFAHQSFHRQRGKIISLAKFAVKPMANPVCRFSATARVRFEDVRVVSEVCKALRIHVHA